MGQYSAFFAGLVSGKLIGDKEPPQQNQFRAEEFCDINEFEAIASLVGPYGVKVIDHELLGFISSNVAQIDEWMKVNELQLHIFSGTWETEQQADQIMDALRGQADPLIVAGVNVGVALAVRRQLHTALKNVLTNTNDQLAQCVEMSALFASNGLRHNAAVSNFPETEATARMAFHTGVVSGPTDFALRDSLAQYNTDAQSAKRWEKLPYAFAATLGSDLWRRAKYKARTGAFESNLHCLTFPIFQVTATMEWITSDNIAKQSGAGGSSSSSHWEDRPIMSAVAARCEDFAACAATTIVRYSASAGTRAAQSPGAKSGSYTTASSMYIFLDKFAEHVGEVVPRSSIEQVLPYDLIRSAYLAAYEGEGEGAVDHGTDGADTPAAAADE